MIEYFTPGDAGNWWNAPTLTIEDDQGIIDEDACTTFTYGQCHALARALHDATGWDLVIGGFWDARVTCQADLSPDAMAWEHMAVRHPDGSIVDINGCHLAETWEAEYGRAITINVNFWEAMLTECAYEPVALEVARKFVPTIMEEV